MHSARRGHCFERQRHKILDLELQNQQTEHENGHETGELSTSTAVEILPIENEDESISIVPRSRSYFEIFLNFCHFIGISPFWVDNYILKSSWLKRITSILITTLAMAYTVFDIRRLAWELDEEYKDDPKQFQQVQASTYIGLVYQFGSLLLNVCLLQMLWCKRTDFLKLFKFLDLKEFPRTFDSSVQHFLAILLSILLTIPVSIICTIGGLDIKNIFENWSFTTILQNQESMLLLGLKKSYLTDYAEYNISIRTNATSENYDTSGIFMNDGHLETIIFGSIGLAIHFCHHVLSLVSYDCLLLSTLSLWIPTKALREQLERFMRRESECNMELETADIVNDIVVQHKQLSLLSKQINNITKSIVPAIVFICIISTSYFMHNCVIRQWNYAILLALKLSKVCVALYFAMKTSSLAQTYFNWFMSEDVQQVLDLNCKQLQRNVAELKENPIGVGSSVFYIDIRFMLSALGIVSTYFYMVTGIGT